MRKQKFVLILALIIFSGVFIVLGQSQVVRADSFFYESEYNNSQSTANGPVNKNTIIVGITDSGTADWYKFPCAVNNVISFYLDGDSNNITAYLYDYLGNNLGPIRYHETYTFNPGFSGYLYVQISGTPNTPYTFSHTTRICFETELNNSLGDADMVFYDTIVGTTDSGTTDWFKIGCVKNVPITFYLDGYTYYISGSIYNSSGTYLGAISYQKSYVFTPTYNGVIYVEIGGYSGIPYTLGLLP